MKYCMYADRQSTEPLHVSSYLFELIKDKAPPWVIRERSYDGPIVMERKLDDDPHLYSDPVPQDQG